MFAKRHKILRNLKNKATLKVAGVEVPAFIKCSIIAQKQHSASPISSFLDLAASFLDGQASQMPATESQQVALRRSLRTLQQPANRTGRTLALAMSTKDILATKGIAKGYVKVDPIGYTTSSPRFSRLSC